MVNGNSLLSTMKLFPIPSLIKLNLMITLSETFSLFFMPKLNAKENYTTRRFVNLFKKNKLKPENIDHFKEENPISPEPVFVNLMKECVQYPHRLVLLKLALLITLGNANMEKGFSVLTL